MLAARPVSWQGARCKAEDGKRKARSGGPKKDSGRMSGGHAAAVVSCVRCRAQGAFVGVPKETTPLVTLHRSASFVTPSAANPSQLAFTRPVTGL